MKKMAKIRINLWSDDNNIAYIKHVNINVNVANSITDIGNIVDVARAKLRSELLPTVVTSKSPIRVDLEVTNESVSITDSFTVK